MAAIEMRADLSSLLDALASGDREGISAAARAHLQQGEKPEVLLGRIGLIAAQGDADGHPTMTLGAAAMLCRLLHFIPEPLDSDASETVSERALPLFLQALLLAAPAVRGGVNKPLELPAAFFPSALQEGQSVSAMLHEAIYNNNTQLVERLLLGLYGTGADYRTLQVRTYDGIASTFQNAGHPLMFAVRGFQVLDAVEWGNRAPAIIHWLAPHLPLPLGAQEPDWIQEQRSFVSKAEHDVSGIRTRLALAKDESALPLRALLTSDAATQQVCQGVYDALIGGGASARAVASVITLAAADILLGVGDQDRTLFINTAHGLLFASAVRTVFQQVQDVDVLPLLFTSAAYINALYKEIAAHPNTGEAPQAPTASRIAGGGLVATSLLETLAEQLNGKDYVGSLTSAHRYLSVGYDARALFATIALAAGHIDATGDQGHALQIVQAAGETFLLWPPALRDTNHEVLLQVAVRAALYGQRAEL